MKVEYEVVQRLRVGGSRRGIHGRVEVGLAKGRHGRTTKQVECVNCIDSETVPDVRQE